MKKAWSQEKRKSVKVKEACPIDAEDPEEACPIDAEDPEEACPMGSEIEETDAEDHGNEIDGTSLPSSASSSSGSSSSSSAAEEVVGAAEEPIDEDSCPLNSNMTGLFSNALTRWTQ
jgi:hypothetical protein